MNGDPSDVGYNPQGVPSALIEGLINRKSPHAAGIQGLLQSPLFSTIDSTIKQQSDRDRQKQLVQKLAMAMQNYSQPQQGPPAPAGPPIQGPAGYAPPNQGPNSTAVPAGQTPMQQNPTSGMGAPTGQDSSQIIGALMQMDPGGELVQKLIAQRMGLNQPTPLQQSQTGLNNAKTAALQKGPTGRPAGGQGGWRAIQDRDGSAYLYNESTGETRQIRGPATSPPPKPMNPAPVANSIVNSQKLNNAQLPWWKKLMGDVPPIVNPLQQQNQQSGVTQPGQMFNGKKVVSVQEVQ